MDVKPKISKLREFMFYNGWNLRNFAKRIGYSEFCLSGYLNGKVRISKRLAEVISKETGYKISVEDLLSENPAIEVVRKRPLNDARK